MAQTDAPKAEGVDRHVERGETGVGYVDLPKPELVEVPKDELTEGFDEVSSRLRRFRDEESVRAKITEVIEESANLVRSETYFLWHEKSGRLFGRKDSIGPWIRSAAQRKAGYRRFAGSAHQEKPGFAMRSEDLHKYYVKSNVQEDGRFDVDADYLEATDRLSEPFDGDPDPEFTQRLLDAVFSGTHRHDGFESLVLGRPSNRRTQMDHVLSVVSDQPADAPHGRGIHLEGPDDPSAGFFEMMEGSGDGEEPEPRLELCQFRGMLPNIPGLEGEWVCLEVANRTGDQREFLEAVAARIGNGARVFVEGYRGKSQVLVPIKLGFAA